MKKLTIMPHRSSGFNPPETLAAQELARAISTLFLEILLFRIPFGNIEKIWFLVAAAEWASLTQLSPQLSRRIVNQTSKRRQGQLEGAGMSV